MERERDQHEDKDQDDDEVWLGKIARGRGRVA